MKKLCLIIALLMFPAIAWAKDRNALYVHCLQDWGPEAVGEILFIRAIEQGYPVTAPNGGRSGEKAYQLGAKLFLFAQPPRNFLSAVLCTRLVRRGPAIFPEW